MRLAPFRAIGRDIGTAGLSAQNRKNKRERKAGPSTFPPSVEGRMISLPVEDRPLEECRCRDGPLLRLDRSRHHDGQPLGIEPFLCDAFDVVERHRLDQRVALGDIADRQARALEGAELRGDAGIGREGQRKGAGQIGLGVGQFLLRRAVGGEFRHRVAHHRQRLRHGVGARGDLCRSMTPALR